jgi:arylsulfatase A-like enzyme
MVEAMDLAVGKVADALDRLGLAENTAVFFMSDNGGLSTSEGSPTSNLPLRGGKGWMYEGGIREPMFVVWPGRAKPGSQCSVPVTSTDFYPTILAMTGRPLEAEQHVDGRSLVPLLDGGAAIERDAIYWHYPHYGNQGGSPASAVRAGDWKLIEWFEDGGRLELFNLKEDIGEQKNLAETNAAKTKALHAKLQAWRNGVGARLPTVNPAYKK